MIYVSFDSYQYSTFSSIFTKDSVEVCSVSVTQFEFIISKLYFLEADTVLILFVD